MEMELDDGSPTYRATRVHRLVPALLIGLLALGLLPVASTHAQKARTISIEAVQCPPGYTGSYPAQHCSDRAAGIPFTVTVGDVASQNISVVESDGSGEASLNLGDASTVSIKGPAFLVSTTGTVLRPVVSVQCVDEYGHQIAGSSHNPGLTYTLPDLDGARAITCNWYIGAVTDPLSAWQGGYADNKPGVYPGEFVSIYGANSDYPAASVTFERDAVPRNGAALDITGLDDEWERYENLEVSLNGIVIYSGPSEFPNWYLGMEEPGSMCFDLPQDALVDRQNTFTISDREPNANFGTPPYVLLGESKLVESCG